MVKPITAAASTEYTAWLLPDLHAQLIRAEGQCQAVLIGANQQKCEWLFVTDIRYTRPRKTKPLTHTQAGIPFVSFQGGGKCNGLISVTIAIHLTSSWFPFSNKVCYTVAASFGDCRLVSETSAQLGVGLHDNKRIDNCESKLQDLLQSHSMG